MRLSYPLNGRGVYAVSDNGVLAYRIGNQIQSELAFLDQAGIQVGALNPPARFGILRIDANVRFAAVERADRPKDNFDIWLYDLARGFGSRFTNHSAADVSPVWSPSGDRIAFASNRDASGIYNLYIKPSGGIQPEELLFESTIDKIPLD